MRPGVGYVIRILFKQLLDDKAFRERKRITLDDVCAQTGLSRTTVGRLSSVPGYVTTTDTVEALCRYFECTPCELMVLVDEVGTRLPEGRTRTPKRKR